MNKNIAKDYDRLLELSYDCELTEEMRQYILGLIKDKQLLLELVRDVQRPLELAKARGEIE